jgi:hypothetical protein
VRLTARYEQFFGPVLIAETLDHRAWLSALREHDCGHVVVLPEGEALEARMAAAQQLLEATRELVMLVGKARQPVGVIVETSAITQRMLSPFPARFGDDSGRLAVSLLPGLPPAGLQKAALAVLKAGFGLLVPLEPGFDEAGAMRLWTAVERAKPLTGRGVWIEQREEPE